MSSIISIGQATSYAEKDYDPIQVLSYHTVRHEDNEAETKTNGTATFLDPKPAPTQAFTTHFLNQSYTKPDQVIRAGFTEDLEPSSADLLFDSLFSCERNPVDLSGYVRVSQSYVPFVTTVDAYRTVGLPEDTNITA